MIEARELTKTYGSRTVVDRLTFAVRPGVVTGFLGPNGAGKSTTMRMILGLTAATGGQALVNGVAYRRLTEPLCEVGALLDAHAVQGFRTGGQHLDWIARAIGVAPGNVTGMLERVGLAAAGDRKIGEYSLGMRQRLGLAAALLGDPGVLILDEPTNGLDPQGIKWLRTLLRGLADDGRTVFLSSHLMGEMELTAERVIIINQGRFVADMTVPELTARTIGDHVFVASGDDRALEALLAERGVDVEPSARGLTVSKLDGPAIGALAFENGIVVHELRPERTTLEEAFMTLTSGKRTGVAS
jgi:ABC-2 type transport system ATP-binding protein